MNAFINDELINIICLIINYYNNDFIRNLWFTYVDYYNINSVQDNEYILINHAIIFLIVFEPISIVSFSPLMFKSLSVKI